MIILSCDFINLCLRVASFKRIKLSDEDMKEVSKIAYDASEKMNVILARAESKRFRSPWKFPSWWGHH